MLQIEPCCTGIRGQKYPAVGIVAETLHQRGTFFRGRPAVETDIADAARFQTPDHDVMGACPLAEHHGLGLRLLEQAI